MQEEWRPVKGYEGYYEVSNLGQVRSIDRIDRLGRLKPGIIIKQSIGNSGYSQAHMSIDGNSRMRMVHRMVAEAFVANDYGKCEVNHIDGNKLNNRADNLELVTPKENMRHAVEHGLMSCTDEHKRKIRESKRKYMKPVIMDGAVYFESIKEAARKTGVKKQRIRDVAMGRQRTTKGHTFAFVHSEQ